jgi:hypothetical protein
MNNFLIDLLHIPTLILKLYIFIRVISLMMGKIVPDLARAMEMTTT